MHYSNFEIKLKAKASGIVVWTHLGLHNLPSRTRRSLSTCLTVVSLGRRLQVQDGIPERSLRVFELVVDVSCDHMHVISCMLLTFITVGLKLRGKIILFFLQTVWYFLFHGPCFFSSLSQCVLNNLVNCYLKGYKQQRSSQDELIGRHFTEPLHLKCV